MGYDMRWETEAGDYVKLFGSHTFKVEGEKVSVDVEGIPFLVEKVYDGRYGYDIDLRSGDFTIRLFFEANPYFRSDEEVTDEPYEKGIVVLADRIKNALAQAKNIRTIVEKNKLKELQEKYGL